MFNLINRNIVKLNKFSRFNSSNKIDNQIKEIEKNVKKFAKETNLNNIKYYKNKKELKKKNLKK